MGTLHHQPDDFMIIMGPIRIDENSFLKLGYHHFLKMGLMICLWDLTTFNRSSKWFDHPKVMAMINDGRFQELLIEKSCLVDYRGVYYINS